MARLQEEKDEVKLVEEVLQWIQLHYECQIQAGGKEAVEVFLSIMQLYPQLTEGDVLRSKWRECEHCARIV